MGISIFEGIGGSGKTTIINLLRGRLPNLDYVHEDRSPAPKSALQEELNEYFINRNLDSMHEEVKKMKGGKNIIFDRSYISAIAIAYAQSKKFGHHLNLQEKIDYVEKKKEFYIDNLFICLCESKKAVSRRTKRDGFEHPIWSDIILGDYMNEFYIQQGNLFAKNVVFLNSGDDLFYAGMAYNVDDAKLDHIALTIK